MSTRLNRTLSPTYVLSTILIVVLGGALLGSLEWRYKLSYSVPIQATQGDLGFRYRQDEKLCRNELEETGSSEGFWGECGSMRSVSLKRIKIQTHRAVASLIQKSDIDGSFIEWLSGPASRWEEVQMKSGQLWDSDFQHAILEDVTFESMDIRGVSFRGAKLNNVTFRDSRLLDISFREALLTNVTFENSSCQYCDFSGADMGNMQMDRPFQKAVFSLRTQLPFPYEQIGKYGFELRD